MPKLLTKLLILILLSSPAMAETIRLAVSEQLYRAQLPWIEKMQQAMTLAGHELELIPLPGKRALMEANNGVHHGDAFRGEFVLPSVKNLTPVKVPVDHFNMYAWSVYNKNLSSLEALNTLTPIGIRGFAYFDQMAPEIAGKFLFVDSMDDVHRILTNRADTYFVGTREFILGLEKQQQLPAGALKIIYSEPIKSFSAYCFIHADYAYLIPQLEAAFAQVFTTP